MHDHFANSSITEGILGIIDSAITQCIARHPNKSAKQFAAYCDMTYQVFRNKFCKNETGRYLTRTTFKEMGTMLRVLREWDEEIYWWAIIELSFGTIEKGVRQLSMFIFAIF